MASEFVLTPHPAMKQKRHPRTKKPIGDPVPLLPDQKAIRLKDDTEQGTLVGYVDEENRVAMIYPASFFDAEDMAAIKELVGTDADPHLPPERTTEQGGTIADDDDDE